MTRRQKLAYLKALPLAQALWWFIENVTDEDPARQELFFALRARMRCDTTTERMLLALRRLTHPAADDTDLEFALDVIREATS